MEIVRTMRQNNRYEGDIAQQKVPAALDEIFGGDCRGSCMNK